MTKLSVQLKKKEPAKRVTRTERILAQQKSARQQRELTAEKKRVEELNKELKEFQETATYKDYESEYKKLSPSAKERVMTPSELKATEDYQKYSQQKAQYEKQLAEYQEAERKARDIRIAKKFFERGISPQALTKTQRKYYYQLAEDKQLYEEKLMQPEKFTTDLPVYQKDPVLKQAVISGDVTVKKDVGKTSGDIRDDKYIFEEVKKAPPPKPTIEPIEPAGKDTKISKAVGWFGEKASATWTTIKSATEKFPYALTIKGTTFPKLSVARKETDPTGERALKIATTQAIPSSIKQAYESIPDRKIETYREGTKEETLKFIEDKQKILTAQMYEDIGIPKIAEEEQALKQQDFESQYLESIQSGEITFDKARREYEKSDRSRLIEQRYSQRVQNALSQAGISKESFKIFGYEKAKAIRYLPTTYKGAITGTLAVKGGLGLFKMIPSKVIYGGVAGLGVKGTYDYLAPTSDPVKRVAGLTTAITSGALLSYGALKYSKMATTRPPVKIPAPRIALKTKEIVGIKTKTGALFPKQKIAQYKISGTRVPTSRVWRDWIWKAGKKVGIKLDDDWFAVSRGVPIERIKPVKILKGLRGTTIIKEPSLYQREVLKFRKDYGLTSKQAKSLLRYTAPRTPELYLKSGAVTQTGRVAIKRFDYILKQPAVQVDKTLGIKTRGASPIKIEKGVVAVGGKKGVSEVSFELRSLLRKGKPPKYFRGDITFKGSEFKLSPIKTGYAPLKITKTYKEFSPVTYQKISERIIIPKKIAGVSPEKTILVTGKIDATKLMGFKPAGIKKTPFSKTFEKVLENLKKEVSQVQKTETRGVVTTDSLLTSPTTPTVSIKKVSSIGQRIIATPKTDVTLATLSSTALMSGSRLNVKQLTQPALRLTPKISVTPKDKISTDTAQDTSNILKSALRTSSKLTPKQQLTTSQLITTLVRLPLRTPLRTSTRPTRPIPFLFGIPSAKKIKRRGQFKTKLPSELAYLPDFTARAIGLKPKVVTRKQAEIQLRKLLTGLEVRRGLIIK